MYNPDNCRQGKNDRIFRKKNPKPQDKLAKKFIPLKKSGGNFSPVLSLGIVVSPSRSHYCTLIRTTATPIFPSFSFSMGPMSCIYCHLFIFVYLPSLHLLPLCFLSYPVVSLILPGITFRLLKVMFLAMPPLLCFPMDSMLVTGETFCLQYQNQHSKQMWEHGTIGLHSNCHLLPWRKHRLPSHSEYGAFL